MNSHTVLTGLFGHPVGHSLSPVMHNRAFNVCGLNYRYAAFDIQPERVGSAVDAIRALGIRGVNVTVPHKISVIPYLDEIDEEAALIGAVNTIVNENGRLVGYNTDGRGYVRSLVEESGINVRKQSAVMIGAGGGARGVAVALLQAGLPSLVIVNRSVDKAKQLAEDIKHVNPSSVVHTVVPGDIPDVIKESTLLIQTTSVGMHPNVLETPLAPELLHEGMLVSDLVYNPLQTKLLQEAHNRGARTHGGLGMLIYQGALSFEYWTGIKAPVDEMRAAAMKELEKRS